MESPSAATDPAEIIAQNRFYKKQSVLALGTCGFSDNPRVCYGTFVRGICLLSLSPRRVIYVAIVARLTDGVEGNRYYLNDDSFTFSKQLYF